MQVLMSKTTGNPETVVRKILTFRWSAGPVLRVALVGGLLR